MHPRTIVVCVALLVVSFAAAFAHAAPTSDIIRLNPETFNSWMQEGGYSVRGDESLPEFRHKVIMRAQKFITDILIKHGRQPFDASGKKVTSKPYPYFAFIPPFVGSLIPGAAPVTWSAPCFKNNVGFAVANPDGSFTLNITLSEPSSLFCSDNYIIHTMEGAKFESYFFHGTQTISWTLAANATESEMWDVKNRGFRVYVLLDDLLQTLDDVLATLLLFGSELSQGVPSWVAAYNIDFLNKYAGVVLTERNTTSVPVDESLIQSGDFFGVLRLDGLDPMLGWAMGSTTGHTTVALRMDGQLYVVESTVKDSYWPTDGIQKTPYQTWIQQARAAGYNVVWSPLSAKYRSIFNATAAAQRFLELEGVEYGYRNLLYGWVDTLTDNYPCLPPDYTQCLQWEHVEVIMSLLDRVAPAFGDMLFNQAFNIRLGTSNLKAVDLFYVAGQKNIPLNTLPVIVEQDSFVYNTTRYNQTIEGPSMVCCVFVCNMWKAAGIFDAIDNEINCAELTNWDDYSLDIFDLTTPRPSQCVSADPNNNLCQLEGQYTLVLNNYSSKNMYPHIAESCPSLPPHYQKPANC